MKQPKYQIYIPSRGRWDCCFTAKILSAHNIDFFIVVEPQEVENYEKVFPGRTIVLPKNNGGISFVRNYIKQESQRRYEKFHWQIDDNIKNFKLRENEKNINTSPEHLLCQAEAFCDLFSNVGISGLSHHMFAFAKKNVWDLNKQVYSCVLVNNNNNISWRENTVEDTDYSLQILNSGLCTILFNRFLIEKPPTMKMKGGNTDTEYVGNGRINRSLGLIKAWPGAFKLKHEYGRPKIAPSNIWKTFKQELIRK